MPDSWLMVQFDLHRDEVPLAESACERLGALLTWVEGADAEAVLEPAPGETPLWEDIRMSALLPGDAAPELLRIGLVTTLPAVEATLRFSTVADRDWDAEWRRTLKPLRFGARTWVCPSGQTAGDAGAVSVLLDPGMAFGTGTHPTTALCLEWLDGLALAGVRVLDYGCGSGILGIAALALGADTATGVDNDPQALLASRDNAERNGLGERLSLVPSEAFMPAARFDVIVANILSGVLIRLSPQLAASAAPGTRVALSGILADQADEVTDAFRSWIQLSQAAERDGWILLTGQTAD